jgi:hypothetical protein
MWEPRRLITLWAFMTGYRDGFFTTKKVAWKMLQILLNVHQFAYEHFTVFTIPSIKINCSWGLQIEELEADVRTGQSAVTLVRGREKQLTWSRMRSNFRKRCITETCQRCSLPFVHKRWSLVAFPIVSHSREIGKYGYESRGTRNQEWLSRLFGHASDLCGLHYPTQYF